MATMSSASLSPLQLRLRSPSQETSSLLGPGPSSQETSSLLGLRRPGSVRPGLASHSQSHLSLSLSLRSHSQGRPGRSSALPRGLRLRASAAEAPASAASEAPALLKEAAAAKKVPGPELARALVALEKASRSGPAPSDADFLQGLGGTKSPGRMWRLVFTTNGKTDAAAASGSYFPLPARQRFDAEAMEIENGVYLGPVGYLTFTGPMAFKSRRLSFLFHTLTLKLGPLPPFKFDISSDKTRGRVPGEGKEGKEDPFFVWFHVEDEIVAGRGRGGGVAFWAKYEGPPRG